MRQAAKRDTNEAEIVAALRQMGATVQHLSAPGVPDLLVGFRGNNYLLEVKTAKGKLTEPEHAWFEGWRGQCVIVRSVEEALQQIGAMT